MKRVKPRNCPSVLTACVARGPEQTGYRCDEELNQSGRPRQVASISAPQLQFHWTGETFALHRAHLASA